METIDLPRGTHLRPSVVPLLIRTVALLFLIETAYAILLAVATLAPAEAELYPTITGVLWVVSTIKFIAEITLLTGMIATWAHTAYYLSDKQLVRFSGIVKIDEKIFDLINLKSVELHQGWWGRIFDYGHLDLLIASSGTQETIRIRNIKDPKMYERGLRAFLSQQAPPPTST